MSVKQTALVWDHSPLRAERLLVHLAIADHMDHEGRGFVSWRQIQAKARVGQTVVYETVKDLQQRGFMIILEAARGPRATVYQLVFPNADTPSTPSLSEGVESPGAASEVIHNPSPREGATPSAGAPLRSPKGSPREGATPSAETATPSSAGRSSVLTIRPTPSSPPQPPRQAGGRRRRRRPTSLDVAAQTIAELERQP